MAVATKHRRSQPSSPDMRRVWSPHRSDFAFFGFDALMPQVDRLLTHVEIRDGEPEVSVVDNAVYVPAREAGLPRRGREKLASGLDGAAPAQPGREIDEEVVYLGWFFNHYGHFLMQSLARVWYLAEIDPAVRVVFHQPGGSGWEPAPWAMRMLDVFGIPEARILVLHEPARIRRLLVPEPLFTPRSVSENRLVRAHQAMAQPYRELAERIAADARPSPQPLYLSRRLLPSSQRLIIGEEELEEILRKNGFRIAHPQLMMFEDQVRLMNEHEDIVSNAGSAAQNVLFAVHQPRLHLLTNGQYFSPDYFLHSSLVGAETSFVNCLGTGGRRPFPGNKKLTPHLLDTTVLIDYLSRRGLLPQDATASTADSGAAILARYDEAWLYGRVRALVNQKATIPERVERQSVRLARSSWPMSLILARYYATHDAARGERWALRFVGFVESEAKPERLARHRSDAEDLVQVGEKRFSRETAKRLAETVNSRFRVRFESLVEA